jgi:hypothetical protein
MHVTNGDAVVPELAAAAGVEPAEVLVWRDVLHEGPVPAGLGAEALAEVRARHLAARGWTDERTALAMFRERDARLAAHPDDAEVVLWFEDDLFDALQLAQLEDRLAGRLGPVTRVHLRHPPRGDRLERQILEALASGPLRPPDLFTIATASERPPWVGDAALLALADDLAPLVTRDDGRYELTPEGAAVLAGNGARLRVDRWLGGVHLGPGHPGWAYDATSRRLIALD